MLTGLGRGPEPAPLPVTASAVLRVPQAAVSFVCNQKLYTKKSRGRPTGTKCRSSLGRVCEDDSSSGTAAVWVVGQFDCGRVPGWKIDGPKRIFPGWRQLCNAIAAPRTDALKRSSWYRIRVTRSARSAELL